MSNIIYLGYFGSVVRSDCDARSDADVLCVIENDVNFDEENLRKWIVEKVVVDRVLDISIYSSSRLIEMWNEGHLFAWHIYLESRPFDGYELFVSQLGAPDKYNNAVADILRLNQLLLDVRLSLGNEIVSKVYEAGLIYVAARNIGISASWYSKEGLDFSRLSPYSLVFNEKKLGLPIPKESYAKLIKARHASMRGGISPYLSINELISMCDAVLDWSKEILDFLEKCHE
ncbi:nucleotidyltransferase domain-containing protein [Vreelandella aquamarina]|uniref:nucleotidyltransferase domain-containing protein n=1 Tax=Vreelandella aquamarina TaxID=77097 RepID=UPI0013312604|nr:nucleotidyltransferase domain-containing protein [Halomonas meridiana]